MIITSSKLVYNNATPQRCNAITIEICILQYCAMRRNFIVVNEDIFAKTISYFIFFSLLSTSYSMLVYTLEQLQIVIDCYNILYYNILIIFCFAD